ncbi:hypothetical protein DERP_012892 [Dermatophagoides pteronyssinus]|uniref:Uncharacterized protein n=1 Tax=Dermatophagoides pteronyssinus TaxID=6956 RepID=A0ABQ8J1N0_DERPT|nr:hypothetical protein DERP_012892 [Dermatophagoides pteronyssinus]
MLIKLTIAKHIAENVYVVGDIDDAAIINVVPICMTIWQCNCVHLPLFNDDHDDNIMSDIIFYY